MEYISSFFQNVKDKLTNPFFGTLTFVLIIHHWEFWYSMFNFDTNFTLQDKVKLLKNLGAAEFTWSKIKVDLAWAALLTILGYFLIIAVRTLSLFIEHKAMPFITNIIVSKNVVLKDLYNEVAEERDKYAEQYEEQRKNVRQLSKDFDTQTEQISQKDAIIIDNTTLINSKDDLLTKLRLENAETIEKLNHVLDDNRNLSQLNERLESDISDLEEIREKQQKTIETINEMFHDTSFWLANNNFPPKITELVKVLKSENLWESFKTFHSFMFNGGNIHSIHLDKFEKYELITQNPLKLTLLGSIIGEYKEVF